MTEILIAGVALIVGAVIASLWRGSLAGATLGPLERQLAERAREIEALKAEHGRASESLRAESERRVASDGSEQ